MNNKANCTTIPSGQPFLDVLANWLTVTYGSDPLKLAQVLVLLPNRRSCRALRETFLRLHEGKAQLLPRMHALGDLAEDSSDTLPIWSPVFSSCATMPVLRREFLLTRLILSAERDYSPAHALELARELAGLIDEATRHEVDLVTLHQLTPEHLSTHWQRTLDFLKLIIQHWPAILREEGLIDASSARHQAFLELAKHWQSEPPDFPVVAAGSTGSQPATARLLGVVSRMPKGMLILPGLDQVMQASDWESLATTHPQYALKQLLERINLTRADVKSLMDGEDQRQEILRLIFAPAEATARWKSHTNIKPETVQNIKLLIADTQAEEARLIALLLRETLETPAKTAALVTPDRALATMVRAQMQRFEIQLDDSAGMPLLDTPAGVFLQLALNWVESDLSPVALLAMLRHPFTALALDGAACRVLSRELEIHLLRGLRRHDSLAQMASHVASGELANFILHLDCISKPILELYAQPTADVCRLIDTHLKFCEALAATRHEEGASILWQKESGDQLATALRELRTEAKTMPAIQPASFGALFRAMLSQHVFRPSYGQHPRLLILSPIEARLQHVDRVILASLNEGVWPSLSSGSPWLSRSMKVDLGLPSDEENIGRLAHDVVQMMAGGEVFLTRARKIAGVVQVPSRWVVRMQTLIEGKEPNLWQSMQVVDHYRSWFSSLDASEEIPSCCKPSPIPPLSARPLSLSTTAIEKFTRNPYDCYAETILRLKPLDPLEEEPSSKHFGQVIHRVLEQFTKRNPQCLPLDMRRELLECGQIAFAQMLQWPAVKALWWPRFESILPWLEQAERESRVLSRTILAEQNVHWPISVDGELFTLKTRIDRLDFRHDGTIAIVDYKTGSPPSKVDIDRAEINQLALYALSLCHGKLVDSNAAMPVDYAQYSLYYWRLTGSAQDCMSQQVATDLSAAKARLEEVVRRYRDPDFAFESYDDPSLESRHSPYRHLSRRAEWDSL